MAPVDNAWVVLALMLLLAQLPSSGPRPLAGLSTHELAQRFPTPARVERSEFRDSQDEQVFFELDYRLTKGERLSLEDLSCILLERGWLRWRDRWPQGVPFAVGMHRPPFSNADLYLELAPRVKNWSAACWAPKPGCTGGWEEYECEDYQVLGMPTAPEMSIEFDLYDVPWDRQTGAKRTPLGSITLHVRAVKSFEECMPALKDEQREAQIGLQLRRALRLQRRSDRTGADGLSLSLDPAVHNPGVALGLAAILRQDGAAPVNTWGIPLGARRGFQWEAGGARVAHAFLLPGMDNVIEQMLARQGDPHPFDSLHLSGQTLVLRGVPRYALRDWDAKEYWAGEIEVPLADLIGRSMR